MRLAPRFLALASLAPCGLAAPPQIEVRVEPREVTLGDPVQVEVTITGDPDVHVGEIRLGPLGENLGQPCPGESLAPVRDGDQVRRIWRTALQPFAPGQIALPTVSAVWTAADASTGEVTAELGQITVASVIPPGINPPGPKAPHGPYELPAPRPVWPYWAAAGALLALAGAWWLSRRRRAQPALAHPVPARPPHELALADLDALERSSLIAEGQFRVFFYTLTDIVRAYFAREFGLGAPEMTSEELHQALATGDYPAALCDQVRRWTAVCDLVKYARQRPRPEHCQAALTLARAIVTAGHQHWLARRETPPQAEAA